MLLVTKFLFRETHKYVQREGTMLQKVFRLSCFENHTQAMDCKTAHKLIESNVVLDPRSPEHGQLG
jgi:hypothetical protein